MTRDVDIWWRESLSDVGSINCNQRNYTVARKPALRLSAWRTPCVACPDFSRNANNPVSASLSDARFIERGRKQLGDKKVARFFLSRRCRFSCKFGANALLSGKKRGRFTWLLITEQFARLINNV